MNIFIRTRFKIYKVTNDLTIASWDNCHFWKKMSFGKNIQKTISFFSDKLFGNNFIAKIDYE